MKKVLLSSVLIGSLALATFLVTQAYFSDTEQSTNNTFSTGTIDIAVDNNNPWSDSATYDITDMKPGQTGYTEFTIENVGSNPANVWKNLAFHDYVNDPVSEPECDAEGGVWVPGGGQYLGTCSNNVPITNLEDVLDYDLSVVVYDESGTERWSQMIYDENITLGALYPAQDPGVFLGMVPSGWTMVVTQSYHMDEEAGNEYQGDSMQYDITLYAEQLKGSLTLENKDPSNWLINSSDSISGTLTYGVKDATFDFSFTGMAPLASTSYTLVFYEEPWSTPAGSGWPRPVMILGTATSDGSGNITISGSQDFGSDILNMKVWLVTSSDLTGATLSGWNPSSYLFETGLIDYYDSL